MGGKRIRRRPVLWASGVLVAAVVGALALLQAPAAHAEEFELENEVVLAAENSDDAEWSWICSPRTTASAPS